MLIELGHDVEAGQPEALFEEVPERLGRASLALVTLLLNQAETDLGRPLIEQELEPDNWAMAISGREIRAVDALELAALDKAWAMRVAQWWQNFDLLVLPTCPVVAQPLSIWRQDPADPWAHRPCWSRADTYTGLFNAWASRRSRFPCTGPLKVCRWASSSSPRMGGTASCFRSRRKSSRPARGTRAGRPSWPKGSSTK